MKETTANIYTALSQASLLENFEKLQAGNESIQVEETNLKEAYLNFEANSTLLVKLIVANTFDIIPYNFRVNMWTSINNIDSNIKQCAALLFNFSNPNVVTYSRAIIQQANALNTAAINSNVFERTIGLDGYQNELNQISAVRKKYESLLKDVNEITALQNTSRTLKKSIEELSLKAIADNQKIESHLGSALRYNEVTEGLTTDITKMKNEVTSMEEDIEAKKLRITTFHTNVEEYEKQIADNTTKLNTYIDSNVKSIKKHFEEYKNETKEITEENRLLQTEVQTYLQGANAGRLYESFQERKLQIEGSLTFWLWGVILNALLAIGLSIFYIWKGEFALDGRLLFKILIAIPVIGLEYFFISQYNSIKALVEEYAFKAAISLSFLPYKDLVEENRDNKDSMDFIISTVAKIYESPIARPKPSKANETVKVPDKILEKLADFGLKQIDKVIGEKEERK